MSEPEEPEQDLAPAPPMAHPWLSVLGVLGSVLLLGGVFLPLSVPGPRGPVDYFEDQHRNILAALAAISFVLTWVFRWYRGLWVTSLLGFLVAGVAFVRFRSRLADQLRPAELGNPFEYLSWNWILHVAGLVLLLVVALRSRSRQTQLEKLPEEESR